MKTKLIITLVIVVLVAIGLYNWQSRRQQEKLEAAFASGNGRLEATEISIASRQAGRIEKILVSEGDLVTAGQQLVKMDSDLEEAELAKAIAQKDQAAANVDSAKANTEVCRHELEAAKSVAEQKSSKMTGDKKRYERTLALFEKKVNSEQKKDDDEAEYLASKADYEAALASVSQAEAALLVANAKVKSAQTQVEVAEAEIQNAKIKVDDTKLYSPRRGRIQYRIAQESEMVSAGGRVLNLADMTDVYMTFFLPEKTAGRVSIGAPVRIILDALPEYPIPAAISYVASTAQFTPKTVETKVERQKLMFRVKARVDPKLVEEYIEYVKTGLPGVAWVKLDNDAPWPESLKLFREREAQKNNQTK